MKVLLDHSIPVQLQPMLPEHDVIAARHLAWDTLRNGDLLRAAEDAEFAAMITADQNIFYRQNNSKRTIALVVLSTNDWPTIAANVPLVQAALLRAAKGSYERVELRARRAGGGR